MSIKHRQYRIPDINTMSKAVYNKALKDAHQFAHSIQYSIETYFKYCQDTDFNEEQCSYVHCIPCLCIDVDNISFQIHPNVEFHVNTELHEIQYIHINDFMIPTRYVHGLNDAQIDDLFQLFKEYIIPKVNTYFINDKISRTIQFGNSFPDEY